MKHLITAALVVALAATAAAQLRRPRAALTPLVDGPAKPGATVRAALKVVLPEGLHTQSNKPSDETFIPTELTFDAPAGVTVTEIVWPPASELKQAGLDKPLLVFGHEFSIGVQFTIAAGGGSGPIVVPGTFRYQACDDQLCYPPTNDPIEWKLTDAAADPAVVAVIKTIPFGSGEKPGSTNSPNATPPEASRKTGASETSPDALLDQFTVLGTAGGYMGTSEFLKFIHNAENGIRERGMFEDRGPFAILVLVLIGGLALNLTPCVLPMIPINLAIIGAGAKASSRGRGFLLGSAYGAAMALVYGALGLVVILTAGTFGTINSSPWFNLAIAVVFVVLGLAMFDVLLIDFSKYSANVTGSGSKGSVLLAFSMGAIAALLAGACVAPVVIQVVLFSGNLYAAGTPVALALPFVLGLGMAIPWPIAGAGLSALPKPGMWMERVKQAFGVFILVTAAYYGYESYSLFANRWVDPAAVSSSVEAQLKAGWHASLANGLETAKRENKPVLIDMWATWCKNCLTMDKTTLASADVQAALANYVKVKYQAEDPDSQPAKGVLQRFSAPGLPAYAILRPKS